VNKRIGNIIFLLVLVAFSLFYYLDAMSLEHLDEKMVVFTLFWGLTILVVVNIAQLIIEIKNNVSNHKETLEAIKNLTIRQITRNRKVILLISILIYIPLIEIFGFFIPSFFFFIALSLFLGTRKISTLILVPVVIIGLTYLFFVKLLHVYLPMGILF